MTTEESLLTRILEVLNDTLRRMSGSQKTAIYKGVGVYTGLSYQSISIREDATAFTTLVCSTPGAADLLFADFYFGTTATLKGDLLSAPQGWRFSAFTLSAGSIQCA
jgi:hypothetical protein